MDNPITNDLFDSRDLIEYKEYLQSELVDFFNDYLEGHNSEVDEDEQMDEIDSFDNVDMGLEGFRIRFEEELDYYESIENFCKSLEDYGDFNHGETIIHEDYFSEAMKDMVKDCGYIQKDLPSFIENNIDWDGVADDLRVNYTEADFEGITYFMRS
jgi:hypothetical protein